MERPSPRSRTPEKQRMPSERSAIDRLHKHRASIFGTPDNVILQRENATAVFPISFAHSRQVYRCRSTNTKRAALRTARPFRCRLKATVPKRNFYGHVGSRDGVSLDPILYNRPQFKLSHNERSCMLTVRPVCVVAPLLLFSAYAPAQSPAAAQYPNYPS